MGPATWPVATELARWVVGSCSQSSRHSGLWGEAGRGLWFIQSPAVVVAQKTGKAAMCGGPVPAEDPKRGCQWGQAALSLCLLARWRAWGR